MATEKDNRKINKALVRGCLIDWLQGTQLDVAADKLNAEEKELAKALTKGLKEIRYSTQKIEGAE